MNLWIKAITYILTENFYFETIHTTKNDIKFINHTMMQAQPCNMNGNIHVQYGIVKQKLCGTVPMFSDKLCCFFLSGLLIWSCSFYLCFIYKYMSHAPISPTIHVLCIYILIEYRLLQFAHSPTCLRLKLQLFIAKLVLIPLKIST